MKIFASMKEYPGYLEVMMKTSCFLLPFVHGVDMCAIEQAILLAKGHEATLVPLALIHVPEERRAKGARLEHIQQSRDFLETIKHKAARYSVPIERLEVFTSDIVQSINLVASEMACEGILLFIGRKNGILLHINEIKRLLEMPTCKLYIMHLQTEERESFSQMLRHRFSNLLPGRRKKQEESQLSGGALEEEVELSIRA
jgi:hypothetical protein